MSKRKHILLIVVGLLLVSVILSTYSTTQIEGSRNVQIDVADEDEQPYLGINVHSPHLSNGNHESVPLLTLRHTHEQNTALRITATVTGDTDERTPPNITADPQPHVVQIGEKATLTVPIVCGANKENTETFTVTVSVRGTNVSMEFTRYSTVTCTGEPNYGQNSVQTTE